MGNGVGFDVVITVSAEIAAVAATPSVAAFPSAVDAVEFPPMITASFILTPYVAGSAKLKMVRTAFSAVMGQEEPAEG